MVFEGLLPKADTLTKGSQPHSESVKSSFLDKKLEQNFAQAFSKGL
jgi:hypothetical protein